MRLGNVVESVVEIVGSSDQGAPFQADRFVAGGDLQVQSDLIWVGHIDSSQQILFGHNLDVRRFSDHRIGF